LCPEGWRIPTSSEWALLNKYTIEELKSSTFWVSPNSNTDDTGFDCRAAGFFNSTLQRFESMLGYTAYWSADTPEDDTCLGAVCKYFCNHVEILPIKKTDAISVRCILDE
jgi:uncharacterized protein (TIGR02145 family)